MCPLMVESIDAQGLAYVLPSMSISTSVNTGKRFITKYNLKIHNRIHHTSMGWLIYPHRIPLHIWDNLLSHVNTIRILYVCFFTNFITLFLLYYLYYIHYIIILLY